MRNPALSERQVYRPVFARAGKELGRFGRFGVSVLELALVPNAIPLDELTVQRYER
jgi:hypothetical protein